MVEFMYGRYTSSLCWDVVHQVQMSEFMCGRYTSSKWLSLFDYFMVTIMTDRMCTILNFGGKNVECICKIVIPLEIPMNTHVNKPNCVT